MRIELNTMWHKYCELAGLPEEEMSPVQRQETKRAFFGACGQLLIAFRDDVGAIEDEEEAVACMEDMIQQVANFWMDEAKKQN